MIAQRLQGLLGTLYDVECEYDVGDFLITDRHSLLAGESAQDLRLCEEQLLLAESADGAGISLFIDAQVLERLQRQDPIDSLTERNVADYCTVLEGVSHFHYAAWRLQNDSPVSLLELETQAEVDKFVATVFLLGMQGGGDYPGFVFARLFEDVEFDARLNREELDRYRSAHRCAARYCRMLESRFVRRGRVQVEPMLREVRKFYRLGSAAKLDYAQATRAG